MTKLLRGMGLFLVWCHRLICIVLSLFTHACKVVCDVNPGIDPYPLLARSCDRWWPDFISFTACEKSRFGLKRGKRGKKAQCISNRCKDLFERKKYFGVRCTLNTIHCTFYKQQRLICVSYCLTNLLWWTNCCINCIQLYMFNENWIGCVYISTRNGREI